jgi:hypothetical protein
VPGNLVEVDRPPFNPRDMRVVCAVAEDQREIVTTEPYVIVPTIQPNRLATRAADGAMDRRTTGIVSIMIQHSFLYIGAEILALGRSIVSSSSRSKLPIRLSSRPLTRTV